MIFPLEELAPRLLLGLRSCPAEAVTRRALDDYQQLVPFLPEAAASFLDIGCGLGGLAALLANHYGPRVKAHLLDGAGWRPKTRQDMGYHDKAAPWSDVGEAARLLRETLGLRAIPWTPAEIDQAGAQAVKPLDLVVSIKSWGHHYSVTRYLKLVRCSLQLGGRLIRDLRTGAGGEAVLASAGFKLVDVVRRGVKSHRAVYTR
jgi:SAM-dependent methyltransferase